MGRKNVKQIIALAGSEAQDRQVAARSAVEKGSDLPPDVLQSATQGVPRLNVLMVPIDPTWIRFRGR
jgi:hypothetical protein